MIRVYRVQDDEGRGPYRPGFSSKWIDEYNYGERCPNVFVEFKGLFPLPPPKVGFHYGCGFFSLDQLNRWFSPTELSKLRAFNYSVVEMMVNKILAKSASQCVFIRGKPLADYVNKL